MRAVIGSVNKISKCVGGAHSLLASLQGGVAAALIKWREATETDAGGAGFLFVLNRKTTPASRRPRPRNIFLIARFLRAAEYVFSREGLRGHRPRLQFRFARFSSDRRILLLRSGCLTYSDEPRRGDGFVAHVDSDPLAKQRNEEITRCSSSSWLDVPPYARPAPESSGLDCVRRWSP